MEKWIEDFKKFYENEVLDKEDKEYFLLTLQGVCFEKGYGLNEISKIIKYVKYSKKA